VSLGALLRRLLVLSWHAMRASLGLPGVLLAPRGERARRAGVLLREALGAMGFTTIKLGQFLAFRFDLFPPALCEELGRLFDDAPPLPFATVRHVVEQELGAPLAAHFAAFARAPLAAASLAQVHRAVTRDGMAVAVKVQRPAARPAFEADMRSVRALARLLDALGVFGVLSAAELLAEFEDFTRRETDFRIEAAVAGTVRAHRVTGEHVPRVRRDLTTTHLLTTEFVAGARLTDLLADPDAWRAGPNRAQVIAIIARVCLTHALEDGLFHADPHPGNILVQPNGTVAFVDFGLFGQLSPMQRHHCIGYIRGLALGDFEASFHHYYRLLIPTEAANRAAFRCEMIRMMQHWSEASRRGDGDLRERHLGTLMLRTAALLRRHHIRMDADLLLFYRLLYVLDSLALRLDPRVDVTALMRDFFAAQAKEAPFCRPDPALAAALLRLRPPHPIRPRLRRARDPAARTWVRGRLALLALALIGLGALALGGV
jgi:ubiquinone biosynthesis protein